MNHSPSNDEIAQLPDQESARLIQLKTCLDRAGITYRILIHEQNISTAQDGTQTGLGTLAAMAPTFVLKTETGYLAAIIRGDIRLSYKKIKQKLCLKNVSLAAPGQVKELTGSEVGYVSLVNSEMQTIVDTRLTEVTTIYGGTGELKHTLQISPQDLIKVTEALVFDFTEFKDNPT
jgi:prolyl-tRNA editing enzyme YbaK/EbsC (Cys-tRNA(Pro) deacylase)